jgi:hypothetical protein
MIDFYRYISPMTIWKRPMHIDKHKLVSPWPGVLSLSLSLNVGLQLVLNRYSTATAFWKQSNSCGSVSWVGGAFTR